jgi:hypothetical protein
MTLPAIVAGVTNKLWEVQDIVTLIDKTGAVRRHVSTFASFLSLLLVVATAGLGLMALNEDLIRGIGHIWTTRYRSFTTGFNLDVLALGQTYASTREFVLVAVPLSCQPACGWGV